VLTALSPGGRPHGLSFPRHPAWGAASFRNHPLGWPRGVSSLCPATQSWYRSRLLGCSTAGAGCPWGSAFPRRQKVPGSLFEPLTPLLHLPRPEWELCREEPQAPLLWVPWETMESAGPWAALRGSARPGPPHKHAQSPILPSSSLNTAFQTLPSVSRASNCLGSR